MENRQICTKLRTMMQQTLYTPEQSLCQTSEE